MLQIFKKSHRRSSSSVSAEDNVSLNSSHKQENFSLEDAEKFYFDAKDKATETPESRPKLSKYLSDILNERGCLCYFVQYLEAKNALPLIKFWIDAESYRSAAELLCGRNGVLSNSKSLAFDTNTRDEGPETARELKRSVSSEGYDSLSFKSQSNESIDRLSAGALSETKPEDDPKSNKLQSSLVADAIRIYRKYLVSSSMYFVDVPATCQSTISLALCNNAAITATLFVEAQKYAFDMLERDHLEAFLESAYYCKYSVEVLTDESLRLTDLLYNESILFYFMEFLEQDRAQQYLEFWMTAVNFKQNLIANEYNKSQAQSDALILYEKYFSLQATQPLHFSDAVRSTVEGEICKDTEDPIVNCFDIPLKIVEIYLEQNYFKPFMQSNLFQKYLTERYSRMHVEEKTVATPISQKIAGKTHKRNNSEPFIAKTNTLLASMDITKPANNMQIDSQQLTDPDMLWRRNFLPNSTPTQNGLSFGRVNAFGRYQREFELNPGQQDIHNTSLTNASNRLKKVVRKLVNLPEDKAQEEIAWQVAEMIVRDVTSITMQLNHENLHEEDAKEENLTQNT
ncbi:A-kinase anchor protein 10, mitochondrial [Culicoides brevitarsis]|uniref:A-kinase anchor protein 10, mitochondrial n=1 Tax=Culicoides brevitarsis TaxID=469753 RepID=UPI00307C677B